MDLASFHRGTLSFADCGTAGVREFALECTIERRPLKTFLEEFLQEKRAEFPVEKGTAEAIKRIEYKARLMSML